MDYLKQLKGYRQKRLQQPISSGAICLYFILLEYDNDLYFAPDFCVANSTLQGLSGLSLKALVRARQELCEKAYILYRKGYANQAGSYRLTDLCALCKSSKPGGELSAEGEDTGELTGGYGKGRYIKQNQINSNYSNKKTKKRECGIDMEELEHFATYHMPKL